MGHRITPWNGLDASEKVFYPTMVQPDPKNWTVGKLYQKNILEVKVAVPQGQETPYELGIDYVDLSSSPNSVKFKFNYDGIYGFKVIFVDYSEDIFFVYIGDATLNPNSSKLQSYPQRRE